MDNQDQYKGRGALDAFLNLFSLITLGWMSIAIGMVVFQLIDKYLGPQAAYLYNQFASNHTNNNRRCRWQSLAQPGFLELKTGYNCRLKAEKSVELTGQ